MHSFGFSPSDATRILEDLKSRNIDIEIMNEGPKWHVRFTALGKRDGTGPDDEMLETSDSNLVLAIRKAYEAAAKKEWERRE